MKKAHFNSSDGYELSLSSTGVVFARFNQVSSGNTYKLTGTTSYPVDGSTWMHIAVVYDGVDIKLYADGVLDGTLAAPTLVIGANDRDFSMGAQESGNFQCLTCRLSPPCLSNS